MDLFAEVVALTAALDAAAIDMSPEAVAARLREMAEVSELCWRLGTGRIEEAPSADSVEREDEA